MRLELKWEDAARKLGLRLAPGARMLGPGPVVLDARVVGSTKGTTVTFKGDPITIAL
jgi:hypothetical protein